MRAGAGFLVQIGDPNSCHQVVEWRVGPLNDELPLAQLDVDGCADRQVRPCGERLRDSQCQAMVPTSAPWSGLRPAIGEAARSTNAHGCPNKSLWSSLSARLAR